MTVTRSGYEQGTLDALARGPLTVPELVREVGASERTMRFILDALRKEGTVKVDRVRLRPHTWGQFVYALVDGAPSGVSRVGR